MTSVLNTHTPLSNLPASTGCAMCRSTGTCAGCEPSAEMRVSNVDKHTKEEECPVRLCNYVDVYKNDRITQGIAFMSATASRDEIEKFRLNQNDVV